MIKTNITGETMIFKNNNGFYATTISKKKQDGSYDNAYINIAFKKGVDLQNMTKINIKSAWLTFDKYMNKEGKENTSLKIFINEFDIVGAKQPVNNVQGTVQSNNDVMFGAGTNSDDLPF